MRHETKALERLADALNLGWGFRHLKISHSMSGRHSLWVSRPREDEWQCHKVDGSIKNDKALEALLDESGVPS